MVFGQTTIEQEMENGKSPMELQRILSIVLYVAHSTIITKVMIVVMIQDMNAEISKQ